MDASFITVCTIISVMFLVIGYACGWLGHKCKQLRTSKAVTVDSAERNPHRNEGSPLPQTPGPLYEELQLNSTPEHEGPVELKENVAYGPLAK